jgi:hypothetical protein
MKKNAAPKAAGSKSEASTQTPTNVRIERTTKGAPVASQHASRVKAAIAAKGSDFHTHNH